MTHLTPEERAQLVDLVKLVVGAAAPEIAKAIIDARPADLFGEFVPGQLMSLEPGPEPIRDYRKELWVRVIASRPECYGMEGAAKVADMALAEFDARFRQ